MNQHTINSILIAALMGICGVITAVVVTTLGHQLLGAMSGLVLVMAGTVTIVKECVVPMSLELEQWRIQTYRERGDVL